MMETLKNSSNNNPIAAPQSSTTVFTSTKSTRTNSTRTRSLSASALDSHFDRSIISPEMSENRNNCNFTKSILPMWTQLYDNYQKQFGPLSLGPEADATTTNIVIPRAKYLSMQHEASRLLSVIYGKFQEVHILENMKQLSRLYIHQMYELLSSTMREDKDQFELLSAEVSSLEAQLSQWEKNFASLSTQAYDSQHFSGALSQPNKTLTNNLVPLSASNNDQSMDGEETDDADENQDNEDNDSNEEEQQGSLAQQYSFPSPEVVLSYSRSSHNSLRALDGSHPSNSDENNQYLPDDTYDKPVDMSIKSILAHQNSFDVKNQKTVEASENNKTLRPTAEALMTQSITQLATQLASDGSMIRDDFYNGQPTQPFQFGAVSDKKKPLTKVNILCSYPGCNFTTNHTRRLEMHQRAHRGEELFACDFPDCDFLADKPTNLKKHKHNLHKIDDQRLNTYLKVDRDGHKGQQQVSFPGRGKRRLSSPTTVDPLIIIEERDEEPVDSNSQCALGGKKSLPKKFKCHHDGCEYLASSKNCLQGHENNHQGIKPFVCNQQNCTYRSAFSGNLSNHYKRVHQSPPTKSSSTATTEPGFPSVSMGGDLGISNVVNHEDLEVGSAIDCVQYSKLFEQLITSSAADSSALFKQELVNTANGGSLMS